MVKKKVLIVGGGFLGYHATRQFLKKDYEVDIVTLPPGPAEGVFDKSVKIILRDINDLSDRDTVDFLKGYKAVVFSAGVDDRVTPKAPAYPFFYYHNVETAKCFFTLAQKAGVKRGVLLSSYFAYFARKWPELKFEQYHPYIRSRIEQEKACLEASAPNLDLVILELPYIFGAMPNYTPLWTPLIKYVKKSSTIYYTNGGTNMIAAEHVGEAIVGAIEKGKPGETYVIGDQNLAWTEFLEKICKIMGKKAKIVIIPNPLVKLFMSFVKLRYFLQGKESGLDPVKLIELQGRKTYFDSESSRQMLGYGSGDLDKSLEETIKQCF